MKLFSWGYEGWGNSTDKWVQLTDAVEQSRGYEPPIFIDTRINRSVRAQGFRDNAFRDLVGENRYEHLVGLGNAGLTRNTIELKNPSEVNLLIDRATAYAAKRQRIIFFCHCPHPGECHRNTISEMLIKAARQRSIEVEVEEWPGGAMTITTVEAAPGSLKTVGKTVVVPTKERLAELGSISAGSIVRFADGQRQRVGVVGPLIFTMGDWRFPVWKWGELESLVEYSETFRSGSGYILRTSTKDSKGLAETCVYTIVQRDRLESAVGSAEVSFHEKKPWVQALRRLREAQSQGVDYPILFADAADCSQLLFWGLLTSIEIDEGTTYHVRSLKRLPGQKSPQDLVLCSSGEKIKPHYIRPYALCHTPSFLKQ